MKKILQLLSSLLLVSFGSVSLAAETSSVLNPDDQKRFDSLYVSVDWLKTNLDKVVIIDARSKADYDKGHIPGAFNKHWTELSNVSVKQGEPGWSVILPPDRLAQIFGDIGIDGSKAIIIYNDPLTGWGEEGRGLWTLRVFGLTNSFILNGGLQAWKAAKYEVNTQIPVAKPRKLTVPQADWDFFASTDYLAENLGALKVLDVREQEEYDGKKNYGEKKNGRIPGSKHIFYKDFYHTDGTIKTPEELRILFNREGLSTADIVVAYCTGGIRSGFATIALRLAGFNKARNYDASFSEWAGTNQVIEN